jgi:hypothetical protein
MHHVGVKIIGKLHFTQLYDHTCKRAFTKRNIYSGYHKTGLYPYNPNIILVIIDRSSLAKEKQEIEICHKAYTTISIPTISQNLAVLRQVVHNDLQKGGPLNTLSKLQIYKLANVAEVGFAERSLLLDKNELLFEQNNKVEHYKSVKSKVISTAKVLSYENLVQAELDHNMKKAIGQGSEGSVSQNA